MSRFHYYVWQLCLLLCAAWGCARRGDPPASLPHDALRAEWFRQLDDLAAAGTDGPSGWPSSSFGEAPSDCDAALWAGEARRAGVTNVLVSQALQADGRPTRWPGADCPSASHTTSTDMQLGTILGLLAAGDRVSLARLQSFTERNGGVVGSPLTSPGDLAFVLMKPGTRTLLARAVLHLGGTPAEPWVLLPIISGPPVQDYQVHLALLALLADSDTGTWTVEDAAWATWLANQEPADALAQAVAGNWGLAAELVLSPAYMPPSYVRGAPSYGPVHRLLVLKLLGAVDG